MTTDAATLAAFREAAARFAAGEIRPMVGDRGRDGDLERLPAVLEAAERAGLVSSPDPAHPGHEYGVWGRASLTEGPAAGLVVLEELAVECAGTAACVHAAGLGALELPEGRSPAAGVAFLPADRRAAPPFPGVAEGTLSFGPVMLPPGCEAVVAFTGRQRTVVALDDLEAEELAPRTGLAAVRLVRLHLPEGTAGEPLGAGDLHATAVRWLLGIAAIAVGAARGALQAAAAYAGERRQGGRPIARHPAVQLLLGEAASRVAAARGMLDGITRATPTLPEAMAIRLRVVENAFQAATDAMQVLGGYGYMEDYRIEKRLRDIMTLRGLAPSPDELRRALSRSAQELA